MKIMSTYRGPWKEEDSRTQIATLKKGEITDKRAVVDVHEFFKLCGM